MIASLCRVLPFVVCAGGVSTSAHALQIVDLGVQGNAFQAWNERDFPADSAGGRLLPVSTGSVGRMPVAPSDIRRDGFPLLAALSLPERGAGVDVPALLDHARLGSVHAKDVQAGWLAQLIAALATTALVVRRRLLVR